MVRMASNVFRARAKEVEVFGSTCRNARTVIVMLATCLALAACSLALSLAGDSLVGKVVAVKSGDLITLDYGAGTQEVRIAGIEIDSRDAMALEAKSALSRLILGKTVRLRFDGYLPTGEMTGRIWVGGIGVPEQSVQDVGLELVKLGIVRSVKSYREYKYGQMARAEEEARRAKRGLWR
jgi:endonuclease YncB( thermonuclease family)